VPFWLLGSTEQGAKSALGSSGGITGAGKDLSSSAWDGGAKAGQCAVWRADGVLGRDEAQHERRKRTSFTLSELVFDQQLTPWQPHLGERFVSGAGTLLTPPLPSTTVVPASIDPDPVQGKRPQGRLMYTVRSMVVI